jgi:DNA invertase Pin-like site-specific DNA recombinase
MSTLLERVLAHPHRFMRIKRDKDEFSGDRSVCLDSRLAIGYARGSTGDQVNSCPRQRDLFLRTAADRNLKLIAIIEDPGTSGEKTKVLNRPQFQELLARCLAEGCYHIFVEDIKRFSRNALDRYIACDLLWKQHGISVHFLDKGLISSRTQDRMVLALLSEIAEDDNRSRRDYCEKTRELLRREWKRCGKQPSFGWENDPFRTYLARGGKTKNYWRPNQAEQDVLDLIFKMAGLEFSTKNMADNLNAQGIKPRGNPLYLKGGGTAPSKGIWFAATCQSVLEHARHQDGRTCVVDKQDGRLIFTIVRQPQLCATLGNTFSITPVTAPAAINLDKSH